MTNEEKLAHLENKVNEIKNEIEALKAEQTDPWDQKVDWSEVTIDTPILVRGRGGSLTHKRYFAGIDDYGDVIAFAKGSTSRTVESESGTVTWDEACIDPDAESIVVWHKNTGKQPDVNRLVVAKLRGGTAVSREVEDLDWSVSNNDGDILEYAVIK